MKNRSLSLQAIVKNGPTDRYLFLFSILMGGFLRFYHIGQEPLWLDEAFSYWFSTRTLLELWTIVPKFEPNPPLYYTILEMWRNLFGSSEACLRSLSAIMSVGCIPLIFMTGRLIGKPGDANWLGAIAALLFSVSPVHIQYAQEARPYAMLTFATTLVLYAAIWIMRHPAEARVPIIKASFWAQEAASKQEEGKSAFLVWVIAIIAITLTLWLHSTSTLYIFVITIVVLTWLFFETGFDRMLFLNLTAVAVIASLLWTPYLVFLIPQTISASMPIPEPTILSSVNTIAWLLLGNQVSWIMSTNDILRMGVLLFLIVLAVAGLVDIGRRSGRYISVLILAATLGPIVMELVFSWVFRPIFLGRTLIYVSVPFYIAVAAGIVTLRNLSLRAVGTVVIVLVLLKGTYAYHVAYEKEPWDKIALTVAQQAKGGVVLLVPNNIEIPFSYYAMKTRNNNFQIVPLPFPMSDFLRPASGRKGLNWDGFKAVQIRHSNVSFVNEVIATKSPVWLITRAEYLFDSDRTVFNALKKKRRLMSTWHLGEIEVFKFIRE